MEHDQDKPASGPPSLPPQEKIIPPLPPLKLSVDEIVAGTVLSTMALWMVILLVWTAFRAPGVALLLATVFLPVFLRTTYIARQEAGPGQPGWKYHLLNSFCLVVGLLLVAVVAVHLAFFVVCAAQCTLQIIVRFMFLHSFAIALIPTLYVFFALLINKWPRQ